MARQRARTLRAVAATAGRFLVLLVLAGLSLQLYFLLRIALMTVMDPQSTAFQRTQAWRIATGESDWRWQQSWRPLDEISPHLARAVIASEDAGFTQHRGVDWDALNRARERYVSGRSDGQRPARLHGGSTISQQLAKNLFLSGERTLVRKGQELVITVMLEALLDKRRILEIYLNSVEWGEGVFGAEAAAQRYFGVSADRLGPSEAARLAVMLPSPRLFERRQNSAYLANRSATIRARMPQVQLP